MNPRKLDRAWPALATLALFALSAASPSPPRTGPAPPSQAAATCDPFSQSGGGNDTVGFASGSGSRQPLPVGLPLASCSLSANGTGWTYANVRLVEWDPLTLAPDPQAIALRTAFLDPSRLNYYTSNSLPRITFVPPIITRNLAGVADPPPEQVAFEVLVSPNPTYSFTGYYAPEGDPAMPAAASFGPIPELSGTHPVTAYALCDGGIELADLRVVQSVNRTDSSAPLGSNEYLQRFRVPEAVEVRWVELGMKEADPFATLVMHLGIVDATGLTEPPATLPPALVETTFQDFFHWEPGPRWAAPQDFDQTVTLLPGRDYWLSLRTANGYTYRTHTLTASESAPFTYAIGAFHHRVLASDPWTLDATRALSFKLIGRSLGSPLSVSPRTSFLLHVTPNPSRAAAEVLWSGATGPVKLEVFDAHGRRVASGGGGAAGRWRIATRDSRPLEPGVYLVHARDSEGTVVVARQVVVR